MGARVSANEIAQKTAGSRIQQQAGSQMTLFVPGIEEDQTGSLREHVFGTGEEFADLGRQGHASQEFGPQAAVCRGEKRSFFHPERSRRLSRLAIEACWHGSIHSKGVVEVAIGAVALQPGGQTGTDGPAPGGPSLAHRLSQCFLKIWRSILSGKGISHRQQPVLGSHK